MAGLADNLNQFLPGILGLDDSSVDLQMIYVPGKFRYQISADSSRDARKLLPAFSLAFSFASTVLKKLTRKTRITGTRLVRILPAISTCIFDLGLSAFRDPKPKVRTFGGKKL